MSNPLRIPAEGGPTLAASHFPATSDALRVLNGRPGVVMAHGLGATPGQRLGGFRGGVGGCGSRHDHDRLPQLRGIRRHRETVGVVAGQIRDYHAALRYLQSRVDR